MKKVLETLPRAKKASWDFIPAKECLEGTRIAVLAQIKTWISSPENNMRHVYWLNGLAGTGKTTVAKSIAHFAADKDVLGASFFCSRHVTDRSDIAFIFPTLAFQLSERFPQIRAELVNVIRERRDIGHALPSTQFQTLIVKPLQNTGLHMQSILMVIDALDEC